MKIVQINSVYNRGSTGKIVKDLNDVINKHGYNGYIFYGRGKKTKDKHVYRFSNKITNMIDFVFTRLFDTHGYLSIFETLSLISKIKKIRPDIIHIHNIHGYYINYRMLVKYISKKDINLVWTLHDCWLFTGHCAYFDYVKCNKWQTECSHCPQKKDYPKSIFIDNSKLNFRSKKTLLNTINPEKAIFVTPSLWLKNVLAFSFLKNYKSTVINNGVDQSLFHPRISDFRKKNNIENKFLILGVANIWDRRKGLKFFLELAKSISINDIIVLIGLNDEQIKSLPDNIIGLERTKTAVELAEIYSSADVFLNPTLEDNFPTTNLESLSCGTPVITFNTGGSPESITEHCGIITAEKNTKSILLALKSMRDFASREEYRKMCLDHSRLYFNKNVVFKQYLDVYVSLKEGKL